MFVFVAGGSGFVGGHLLKALKARGITGRCLVRDPSKARLCEGFEPVAGDIDRELSPKIMEGVDMLVHLVGIVEEKWGQTFDAVHVKGTENLVNTALKAGVKSFFYQSALGASKEKKSAYMRTKAIAEEIVEDSGMPYVVFRPSLILGPWDKFSKQMVELIQSTPVVPVPGSGQTLFQPLYVEDWKKAFMKVLDREVAFDRTYELGGPEHLSFDQITRNYMEALGVKKMIVHVPVSVIKTGLHLMFLAKAAGVKSLPPISREQVELLGEDNVTDLDTMEKNFGFRPARIIDALKEFVPTSQQAQV